MKKERNAGQELQASGGPNRALKPPGYHEIDNVSRQVTNDASWGSFMKEVLKLPGWMVPAVQSVVGQQRWRTAANPIGYLRTAAHRQANLMNLREDNFKAARDRSRLCPCGYMTQAKAESAGHTCETGEVGCIADVKLPQAVWSTRENGEAGRGSKSIGHDTAMDLLLYAFDGCCDDGYEPFYIEEDDKVFDGSDSLRFVKMEFIKLVPRKTLNSDGVATVDWRKAGRAGGLDTFEAEVLELRYSRGYSRQMLMESAGTDSKLRLRYQAAWRSVDRHRDTIHELIKIKQAPTSTPHGALQLAPARKPTLTPAIKRLPQDDGKILRELDDRFGTPRASKELGWGQNLRSGWRY